MSASMVQIAHPKVLVVEDEPAIQRLISKVIARSWPNARIEGALDGVAAGRKLLEFMPSLVVLDLKLPGVDGFDICRALRNNARLKNIVVLAVSGLNTDEAEREAREAGADDFLAKPFTSDDLENKLSQLMPMENGGAGHE